MRSDYIYPKIMEHLLSALTKPNRIALTLSMKSGLRIGDVLEIKTADLKPRMTVFEQKTGHHRRISIPADLLADMRNIAGKVFVFEHRLDKNRHRTRQAINADLRRACRLFRLPKQINVTPHTARKIYAVRRWNGGRAPKSMLDVLGHESEPVAMIYTMADLLAIREYPELADWFRS